MSEEIIWFSKKHRAKNRSDVSLTLVKTGKTYSICCTFRNGVMSDFKTDYVRFGVSAKGTKLFFMPSNDEHGYKLSGNRYDGIATSKVTDTELFDLLKRFIGDYYMGIDDDNHLFISKDTRI